MLRVLIIDLEAGPRLGRQRLFSVSGDLRADDYSVVMLIARHLALRTTPQCIVDFEGLRLVRDDRAGHDAADQIVIYLARLANRRPDGFVFRDFPTSMASRLRECFDAWKLTPPIFY